jgi:membrane-associated HD superfamily phosphohydrolase
VYDDDRAVTFLAVLIVAVSGMAALVARGGLPPELIPVPFATLVVAVLWGGRLALVTALILALLLGGQTPFLGAATAFSAAVGGAAASFGVRLAQRRLQAWAVAGVVGAAYAACALAVGLQRAEAWQVIGWSAVWGVVNATACTLLAIGFLPVAEWFTRVTTAQTLLELADPNTRSCAGYRWRRRGRTRTPSAWRTWPRRCATPSAPTRCWPAWGSTTTTWARSPSRTTSSRTSRAAAIRTTS